MALASDGGHRGLRAVARSSDRGHSAHAGRQAEPGRAGATDRGRQTGARGTLAAFSRPDRRHREEPQTRRRAVPALGRDAVQRAARQRQQRRPDRQLHRRRRAAIGPGGLSVQDPSSARHGGDPLRSGARLSADLHGRPRASRKIPIPRGSATPSGTGKATRSWSRRPVSTTRAGWTTPASRRPTSCTSPSASSARISGTWTFRSRSTTRRRTRNRGRVTQPLAFQADTELLEYICNENNRYFDLVHDFGE